MDQALGARQGQPTGEGGTSVPGDQAPVWLRQGPLSRPGEEHGTGADAVCAVKPVHEAKAVAACRGRDVPVIGELREKAPKTMEIPTSERSSACRYHMSRHLVVLIRPSLTPEALEEGALAQRGFDFFQRPARGFRHEEEDEEHAQDVEQTIERHGASYPQNTDQR